jgi:hypothetical protein
MTPFRHPWIASFVVGAAVATLPAQDSLAPDGIPAGDFDKLRALIRPQEGESNWRRVDWLTSLHEARVKAAAEGKPILLWSGGGAPPLGGC